MNKYLIRFETTDGQALYAEVQATDRLDAVRRLREERTTLWSHDDVARIEYCFPNVPGTQGYRAVKILVP